jgi:hypothetical protein
MRRAGGGGRILRIAILLLVIAVALLTLAQLLLPTIAASTISSRIGRYGKVSSVTIKAFPAIKLLWGDADTVNVVARDLVLTPERTAALLHEARGAGKMTAQVESVKEGPLRLTGVRLHKNGAHVFAAGTISSTAVGEALPPGIAVKLLESGAGAVHVRVSGGLFGVGASVDAVARAESGKLVARPTGFALRAVRLTLFSDPRVEVEGVGASLAAKDASAYRLTMRARLR